MNNNSVKIVVVVAVIAVVVGVVSFSGSDDGTDTATNTTTQSSQSTSSQSSSSSSSSSAESTAPAQSSTDSSTSETSAAESTSSTYENGTYTASGSYIAPPGNEGLSVTLTLDNDVITDISVEAEATHPTSARYQADYIDAVISLVTGVSLDDADQGDLAGSSLTSNGFNQALEQIRQQAS